MSLFDNLVAAALNNQPELSTLRAVVEKELLHHDILRILSHSHLLKDLTFIGGTALRSCYGGIRLSEDLDFTGGSDFSRERLSSMGEILSQCLYEKYGLQVSVSEPIKEVKNVDTWKIKIETQPARKHLPAQRINIDICAVPSYDVEPAVLLNFYGVDMGTSGLIIKVQSREEIYADKILAFALRPNRIKYRDLWDMFWLCQQNIRPIYEFISRKLQDRQCSQKHFRDLFAQRLKLLSESKRIEVDFKKEMQRFLPVQYIKDALEQKSLWSFMIRLMAEHQEKMFKK